MALTRLNSLSIPANTIVAADIEDDSITTAKIADSTGASDGVTTAKLADDAITLAKMDGDGSFDGKIITYDASGNPVHVGPGTDGQVLTSTGAGSPPAFENAASGAYSDWSIITSATNLVVKGQYISNSGSALTHTLPAASAPGNVGDSIIICNAGAGLVTIARNSSDINSAAEDGTLPQGNSVQLVYVSDAIGWFEI